MKKSRKEFIIKGHAAACSEWKANIEKEFPKLFKKDELEVGKWHLDGYKDDKFLICLTRLEGNLYYGYGFDSDGKWVDDNGDFWGNAYNDITRPATDKEVETALIKEAKKRGFKEGVKFKGLRFNRESTFEEWSLSSDREYKKYSSHINGLNFRDSTHGVFELLFINGKWADIIIETITKEQAEKELGKTIID